MSDDTPLDLEPEDDSSEEPTEGQQMIPYNRFSAVVKERNEAKATLTKLQREAEAAKKKALEEQQKWQELYQEAQPKLERLEQLEEMISSTLQAMLDEVPEDMRDLIPGDDVLIQWNWLQKAKNKGLFDKEEDSEDDDGAGGTPPGIPPGAPKGRSSVSVTREQLRDPEWVRENKALIQQAARDGKLPK